MTDKKLNDNEIVKALECCDGSFDRCGECPLDNVNQDKLRCWELEKSALDLINRQKAENERMTIRLRKAEHQLDDAMKMYNTIKAEAYKEFAEEIFELFPADKSVTYITRVTVKHILKELEGDNK